MRDDLESPAAEAVDPFKLARRDLKKNLPRRFWTEVSVSERDGGFGLDLDGKPVKTPAKAPLVVPTAALAEALAEEWRIQTDIVDPDSMPMTRLANTAIDGVAGKREETIAEIAKFAETDLVCYRASEPDALVTAQANSWDPILAFAARDLEAEFARAEGIIFVEQPEAARGSIRHAVAALAEGHAGPFRLAALSVMTNLTGSVLIALAVARDAIAAEAAWNAAHVDEDFQMAKWGDDAEALDRRQRRWQDMRAAVDTLRLCG